MTDPASPVGLGYLQDAPDPRDAPFAALSADAIQDLPEAFSNRPLVVNVLNQSTIGSCVIHSCAQAVRMVERRIGGDMDANPELVSRLWGYYNSRVQHGDEDRDTGTYIRLTIKVMNRLGRPPESVWPYTPARFKERPPLDTYRHAHDFRKANYSRIWQTGDERKREIMSALAEQKPIVFGTEIAKSFMSVRSMAPVPAPLDEQMAGGHAMCAIGYDDSGVEIVNSWGKGWGDGGFARLSWEYILWHRTRDIWVIDL
jgi:C1A family cysteine protease